MSSASRLLYKCIVATLILAALSALVLVGLGLEWLFKRTGVPDVLVLLVLGLVASVLGVFQVEDLRGFDKIFTTAALVLILFEGSVRLRLSELKTAALSSLLITVVGFVVTAGAIAALAWALFGMRPLAAVCLGAILGGTSSAVVIPMLATLPLAQHVKTTLTLESALTDVLCIVFTLALVGMLTAGEVDALGVGRSLVAAFLGAIAIGVVTGVGWAYGLRVLRRGRTSMVAVGAAVFLVFAATEALGAFGAIAVLAFGVTLGNATLLARGAVKPEELALAEGESMFLAEIAFLLKVLFFVYLGAALKLDGWQPFVFGGLATLVVFVVRPIAVHAAFSSKNTTRADATVAAALAPKGLAAAVLAGLPAQAGAKEGGTIEAIVFGTVLFSISIAAAIALFRERPFIVGAYRRVFARFPAPGQPAVAPAPPSASEAAIADSQPDEPVPAPQVLVNPDSTSIPSPGNEG
ncbi:MAG: cation:proton antiporter [Deltaproteobacteria bacterium]|nr:cation:proton antiporter [Deltaproteobacteria bacterium]